MLFVVYNLQLALSSPIDTSDRQLDRDGPIRRFSAEEPSTTPQSIIKFMDEFSMKSFNLFITIHRVLNQKSLSKGQRQEVSMTEAVAHTLRTLPGLSHFMLMKFKHTPNRIFEMIWHHEIVKPCRNIYQVYDAHLESLPSLYSTDDFQPTRIGTLLLFEDICQRITSETSPQKVRAQLIGKTRSSTSSSSTGSRSKR